MALIAMNQINFTHINIIHHNVHQCCCTYTFFPYTKFKVIRSVRTTLHLCCSKGVSFSSGKRRECLPCVSSESCGQGERKHERRRGRGGGHDGGATNRAEDDSRGKSVW